MSKKYFDFGQSFTFSDSINFSLGADDIERLQAFIREEQDRQFKESVMGGRRRSFEEEVIRDWQEEIIAGIYGRGGATNKDGRVIMIATNREHPAAQPVTMTAVAVRIGEKAARETADRFARQYGGQPVVRALDVGHDVLRQLNTRDKWLEFTRKVQANEILREES